MTLSIVAIIEAAHKTSEHSVPLSPTGNAPATHYGLHAWAETAPEPMEGEAISARSDIVASEHFEAAIEIAGLLKI